MTVLETMRAFGEHDIDEVTFPVHWRFDGEADGDEVRCMGLITEGDWLSEALYWLGEKLEEAWYGEDGERPEMADDELPRDNGESFMSLYDAAKDAVLVIKLTRTENTPLSKTSTPGGGTVTHFDPSRYIAMACGAGANDYTLAFCLQRLGEHLMKG